MLVGSMPGQGAAVIGPHGLNLALFAAAAVAADLRRPLLAVPVAAAAVGLILWQVPAAAVAPEAGGATVRLVQPNAPQNEKWRPDRAPVFFERQIGYTAAAPRPDLIVWPETAIPYLLENADPALERMAGAAQGVPLVFGVQRFDGPYLHNSLTVLGPDGRRGEIYDKHHLVPFGEYMPLADLAARWGLFGLAAGDAGYAAGPGPRLIDLGPLGRALPLICYEAVFPQDVGGAPARPDFLLQITNDAWFGERSGPYQHLQQARMRAIEQGLAMVRAANTGISAVIDPRGRIVAAIPLGQAGYADAPLPAPRPPTIYARTGDFPLILSLIVFLSAMIALRLNNAH
jgi:apolipoprotein N-acyltransferase